MGSRWPVSDMEGAPTAAGALAGRETVLLVEDEPIVRELAGVILRELGYNVIEAANGADALHVVQSSNGPLLDIMITDLVMPQMGGRELAARLQALRPTVRVLFTSGYPEDAIGQARALQSGIAFLQKPYCAEALARKVRETLDRAG